MKKMLNLSLASALALACLTGATLAQDNNGNNGGDNNNSGANSSDNSGGQSGKTGAGDNNDPTSTSQDCRDAAAGSNVDCKSNTTAQ